MFLLNIPLVNPIRKSLEDEMKNWISCRNCSTVISSEKYIFSLHNNEPIHVFKNPAGLIYTIITLREGLHVTNSEIWYTDHSWFPPYSWAITWCANCSIHLGWFYTASEAIPPFYGLILDRLSGNISPKKNGYPKSG